MHAGNVPCNLKWIRMLIVNESVESTSTEWQSLINKIRESMEDLVREKLTIICQEFTVNGDCGKCDPWMNVTISSTTYNQNIFWMKVGGTDLQLTQNIFNHPYSSSKPESKDENGLSGVSRQEKISICHSILLLKFDKVFCETFGKELISIEGILCNLSPKCRCTLFDNRVVVPASFSDEKHWANAAWNFCNVARN